MFYFWFTHTVSDKGNMISCHHSRSQQDKSDFKRQGVKHITLTMISETQAVASQKHIERILAYVQTTAIHRYQSDLLRTTTFFSIDWAVGYTKLHTTCNMKRLNFIDNFNLQSTRTDMLTEHFTYVVWRGRGLASAANKGAGQEVSIMSKQDIYTDRMLCSLS